VNGIEQRYFLTTKPGKTGSYLQKCKVLSKTRRIFVYYKILVMNAKKNAMFECKKIRESKTAIMQIESTHVCSALWRIRVDIIT